MQITEGQPIIRRNNKMFMSLRCRMLDSASYRRRVYLNANEYTEMRDRVQLSAFLNALLFTKAERLEREQTRVLGLIGDKPVTLTRLCEEYLKIYGFATGSYFFSQRARRYLPDICDTLESLVESSKLFSQEFEVGDPVQMTGPESCYRFETRYSVKKFGSSC